MNINGVVINCPYWMNKLADGKVILRGFANGKGGAAEIREELIKKVKTLSQETKFESTPENLRKFTRRERIGIDCSGIAYRVLNELVHLHYKNCTVSDLAEVFTGGINKTNANMLTNTAFCVGINKVKEFQLGDMIRMRGGKHIAIIIRVDSNEITYVHSSSLAANIQGIHTSNIQIIKAEGILEDQVWMQVSRHGENFGRKYFDPASGDGVFRLKIFNQHG